MLHTEQVAGDGFFLAAANKKEEQGSSALLTGWLVRPKEKDTVLLCAASVLDPF